MGVLYNIGIFGLGISMRIASLFNAKAKLWVSGRQNLYDNLPDIGNKKLIWFHCASLGEFDQGSPLMEKLKGQDNSIFLLVTFFSPSGMQHYHKRNHVADFSCNYTPSFSLSCSAFSSCPHASFDYSVKTLPFPSSTLALLSPCTMQHWN